MTRPQTTSDSSTARHRPITEAETLALLHRAVEDYVAGRTAELHLSRARGGAAVIRAFEERPTVKKIRERKP